mmetsp:Transcript_54388/g.172779  ORF Transcript_54388/g.172779 Transcript_54388/m.172779 type:complete len:318 (-) Transcript_54388:6-959(-)
MRTESVVVDSPPGGVRRRLALVVSAGFATSLATAPAATALRALLDLVEPLAPTAAALLVELPDAAAALGFRARDAALEAEVFLAASSARAFSSSLRSSSVRSKSPSSAICMALAASAAFSASSCTWRACLRASSPVDGAGGAYCGSTTSTSKPSRSSTPHTSSKRMATASMEIELRVGLVDRALRPVPGPEGPADASTRSPRAFRPPPEITSTPRPSELDARKRLPDDPIASEHIDLPMAPPQLLLAPVREQAELPVIRRTDPKLPASQLSLAAAIPTPDIATTEDAILEIGPHTPRQAARPGAACWKRPSPPQFSS